MRTPVEIAFEDRAKRVALMRRMAKDFGCKVAARDGVAALVSALEAKMPWAKFVFVAPQAANVIAFRRA